MVVGASLLGRWAGVECGGSTPLCLSIIRIALRLGEARLGAEDKARSSPRTPHMPPSVESGESPQSVVQPLYGPTISISPGFGNTSRFSVPPSEKQELIPVMIT